MQVFFENGLDTEKQYEIIEEISKMKYVESAELYTKEQALEEMKEKFKGNEEILNGYEGEYNIFPDSIIVKITDSIKSSEIKGKIEEISGIEKVVSSDNTLNTIKNEIEKKIEKIKKEVYNEK